MTPVFVKRGIIKPTLVIPMSLQTSGGNFSEKKRLRQRTHKLGASKILVPRKNGEPERRSLSVCRGARGAAGPPPGGLGGWKPPRNSRGSGGRQPPSKNNFMDPEPSSDHLQPPSNHLQNQDLGPGSGIFWSKNMKICLKWVHMAQ